MRKKLNSNKKHFYPVSSPYITKKDMESVNRALKRGWISSDGPEIKKFEKLMTSTLRVFEKPAGYRAFCVVSVSVQLVVLVLYYWCGE